MASWCSTARACSAAIAAVVLFTSCRQRELPVYKTVPRFSLTSQTGQAFDSSSLNGSVWVADFFFTNCTGPCPRMSSRFRQIQKSFPSAPDLKFVSITVDPARDTPAVLTEYARKFSAEPGRWLMLTGPVETLQNLSRQVFMLGDIQGDLTHSTRFVLMDRKSQIRGFYQSNEPESIQQLTKDIQLLLKEKT